MLTPDERTAKAIANLEHEPNFVLVKAWLDANLREQDIQNRRLPGPLQLQGQGRAQILEETLEAIDTANGSKR